ncbi:HAMP domain-containing histidine kinase [Paenibacillus albidus]|uniref:sensor histidine kinase n=1 Tax=Paenibacillus albidus TaxID=2041023 RepID=UPI001BE9D1BE|nr:HAMP domain-containing sensor histidine kinase [Paenibacillus albidus]MBT2288373.1 HAMP domain-containing histidine kinase [Paenibacillus albidus]
MRLNAKILHVTVVLFLLFLVAGPIQSAAAGPYTSREITEWQMKFGAANDPQQGWLDVDARKGIPELPPGLSAAWTRIALPPLDYSSPALYVDTLYALHVKVYLEERLVFEGDRPYIKDNYSLLIPLSTKDRGKTIYIWTETLQDRIGIKDKVLVGEHRVLMKEFMKHGLIDIVLGSAFIFVAIVLFVCAFYLTREYFSIAVSLAIVIASTGILSITYSPFIYTFYSGLGPVSIILLDLGLLSLLPSLTFLFEKIFGSGKFAVIRRFRKFQVVYSAFCLSWLMINSLSGNTFVEFYYFISTTIVGYILIAQFILLIACVIIYAARRNKDAIIFAVGFGAAALTGVCELLWYYARNGNYDLYLWKWGLVVFIMSLIVIVGRRLALSHQQVVKYSRELELFNNELQRSEKMEIISELAASVAHEVRNPLQVTRGFLQLLSGKTNGGDKKYMMMALSELDRASNIITDFLTFAKPEFEQTSILNLQEEFNHIKSILLPLCHLNGGDMELNVADNLWVKGSSSKFKQAFINMIKNSIEAFGEEGNIDLTAYRKGDHVFIHIRDNGEGMDPQVLSRLGEPYFSNKTKGTGLGLMVTFRIIEAMQGEVRFLSTKGAGTESITILPLADAPEADSRSI